MMKKPKDLILPYSWDERRVVVFDRVWVIPSNYTDYHLFSFPGWSDPLFFNNNHPVYIEYCSGNGQWIAKKAQENASINWLAVEKRLDRVKKIWAKIKNLNLDNLMVVYGGAEPLTQEYIPDESVENIFINFPDPWPKQKHAKNRLMQKPFLDQLFRIMKKQAKITFVTDHEGYSDEVIELVKKEGKFHFGLKHPHYITDFVDYGSSFFESLWKEKGKKIRLHEFVK